ncbi:MAG TPA: EamA/RhaT family transporter [Bacteroidales bacterium]|nr:EamA/RhaT family transporter [Bacteroidales bacterium]
MLKDKIVKAHLSIIGANLFFGVNYAIAKGIMPNFLKPNGFTLMRIITAFALFYFISLFTKWEKIQRKDYPRFIAAGFLGVAFNQFIFLNGLNFTSPIDSAIIVTINPILVMIIASMAIGERITFMKIFGMVVGASGALLIILNRGVISFSSEHLLGNLMIFMSTFAYAGYLVVAKPLMQRYDPLTVMRGAFFVGLMFIAPLGFRDLINTSWSAIPASIWGSIFFVLLGATFIAYMLMSWGLKQVKATTVSIYNYTQPVIASIVAVIIGQDVIDTPKIIATVMVFLGVYFVSRPSINAKFLKMNRN